MGAGCIVHYNKVSQPVKDKYLLLCMNSIMYFLLTSYTLIIFLKVLSHFTMKIENFMKYFKEWVLKYFKISMKFLNISKWNISSRIPSLKEPKGSIITSTVIIMSKVSYVYTTSSLRRSCNHSMNLINDNSFHSNTLAELDIMFCYSGPSVCLFLCPCVQKPRVGFGAHVCYHCRISPPRFLAECRKRRLNQGSFVLLMLLAWCARWFM